MLSDSMEPSLRPGDLVLYLNLNYTVGDVVVYCLSPSHCVVHRVVGFLTLDTVSGDKVMVVTKGDNVDVPDSPVNLERVRGKVVLAIARELWVPLIVLMVAYSLYGVARTPIVGLSYAILLIVGLTSITAVYAFTPGLPAVDAVKPPIINLAGVYFDPETCSVKIRYTGELSLTDVSIKVNSTSVVVLYLAEREVVVKPDLNLIREAFEYRKPLSIEVEASLNHVGRLTGTYSLLIGGRNPEFSVVDGAILIKNLNGFPLSLNVSFRYLRGGERLWSNQTHMVDGLSQLVVKPPEGAEFAYAYIYWFNQGDARWIGLPVRTR